MAGGPEVSGAMVALPVCDREVEGSEEIRPGDVRLVGGVAGLVVRVWLDGSFIVCPVKPFPDNDDEDVTGRCVFVEMDRKEMGLTLFDGIFTDPDPDDPTRLHGAAMPELGCTVDEEFIGKLLYRVRPEQLRRCDVYFGNGITDTGEPDDLDVDSHNSRADVELGMQMQRDSLRKELDSSPAYVFEDDGSVRVETEAEWRERIRRRKRAERRARKKA